MSTLSCPSACDDVPPRPYFWYWWIVLFLLTGFTTRLASQSLPAGFANSRVQAGYTTPVGLVFSTDGRQLFIWEKSGRVFVSNWDGSMYVRQSAPVIDISEEVGNWRDFGLLSLCLDPNFGSNGLIYLFYAVDRHHLLHYGTSQYNRAGDQYYDASISRVTRYHVTSTAGSLIADNNSRQVLIGETKTTGIPLTHESHAGGTLVFGRDGTLLVSTGDNATYEGVDVGSNPNTYFQTALNDGIMRSAENVGSFRSQMVGSLCGKVLRIDPNTGDGVGSNPFYDASNPRAARSRVWTLGLRNPFRMTIQPNTGSTNPGDGNPGKLLIGDVGWNTAEEVEIIDKAGLNCGWPLYEGMDRTMLYYGQNVRNQDEADQPTFESLCQQPTSPTIDSNPANRRFTHARPALDWQQDSPNARVPAFDGTTAVGSTIGTANAPAGKPFSGNASLGGVYYTGTQFPASYQNSYFFADFGQNWIRNMVLHDEGNHQVHEVREFAAPALAEGIVDLELNPLDGSLYFVVVDGQVRRISYGGNQPPVARPTATVTSGSSPLTVQFSATNSTDPEGKPLRFRWDFGDGTSSNDASPQHVFLSADERSFTITLTVTDEGQLSNSSPVTISLNGTAPTARINSPADGSRYPVDRASFYTLSASTTGGNLTYEWQVSLLHNEHEHPEPVLTGINPQIQISPVGCSSTDIYSYRIALKVTNRSGQSATTSVLIYPDCLTIPAPTTAFAIASVTTVRCETISTGQRQLSFTPQYSGLNGQPITFSVAGEMMPTTHAGPYTLRVYTDNPTIRLQAQQSGTSGTVGFAYNWLSACSGGTTTPPPPPTPPNPPAPPTTPPPAPTVPSTTPPTAGFAITGVSTVRCETISASQRAVTFTPQYSGLNSQPVSFSVVGEMLPTTSPGPYTLRVYTDNPVVTIRATQTNSTGEASFAYRWLAACTNPGNNNPANQPPRPAQTIAGQQTTTGQFFSFVVPSGTFTDPTGDILTYSMSGLPDGLTFDASTATLSGSPTTAGKSTITLTATDPGNLSASVQFEITVGPTPTTTPPPPTAGFAITSVSTVRCETISASQRTVTFTPQYSGLNGQPVSFSIVGEMLPTTSPGPYTLRVYTDNPVVILRATQTNSPGEASFAYRWLASCTNPGGSGRLGVNETTAEPAELLTVQVLGNPILNETADVEIRGATDQWLRVTILDERGYAGSETTFPQAKAVERHLLKLTGPAGLYLLCVSTPTQYRIVKLLKL